MIEKLRDPTKSTIKDHFPEFPDDKEPRNPDHVCDFVYSKFLEVYERCETKSNSVPHYHRTTALGMFKIERIYVLLLFFLLSISHIMTMINFDLYKMISSFFFHILYYFT